MKYIYLFILLFSISCSTTKNVYICGDRTCADKNEFNEYFENNLLIEIVIDLPNKKNKNIDLVELNTINSENVKKDSFFSSTYKKSAIKKQKKIKKKEEKARLKKNNQIKIDEQNKIKLLESKRKEIVNNQKIDTKKPTVEKKMKNFSRGSDPAEPLKEYATPDKTKLGNTPNVCVDIKDCDIDKITELLTKKGRNKNFPDITSN